VVILILNKHISVYTNVQYKPSMNAEVKDRSIFVAPVSHSIKHFSFLFFYACGLHEDSSEVFKFK